MVEANSVIHDQAKDNPRHPRGTEFVYAEKLGDGVRPDELRLTFYLKLFDIDEKRSMVQLFGCVQMILLEPEVERPVPMSEERIERVKACEDLIEYRYNNLDHHICNPTPIPSAYPISASGTTACAARVCYRDANIKGIPE